MQHQTTYTIQPLSSGVWSIEMEMVRAFVVAGETSALLIDTGAGGVNLREAVGQCTDLPIRIVNTHAHYDHISGNNAYDMRFAHPMELTALAKAGYTAQPVYSGSGFDLGGRVLLAIGLPGHTPGSIGLWDAEAGILFAGDAVAKGRPVMLALEGASLEAYIRSLGDMIDLPEKHDDSALDTLYCAHGEVACGLETARALKALAERYQRGEVEKQPVPEQVRAHMPEGSGIVREGEVSLLVP